MLDGYWSQFQPIVPGDNNPPPTVPPPTPPATPPPAPPPAPPPGTPPNIPPSGPNPPAQTPGQGGPTPSPGGTRQQFRDAWLAYAGTKPADQTYVQWLQKFVSENPQYGVTLGGSKGDKVYGPGGEFWADAITSSGINGGTGASWNESTDGGSAADGFGAYTAPFTERYSLPSLSDLQHMPGYQAGLDAYTKGVQTSAASKGTLLTGGTLQRLGQAGTDYANQAYSNLANLQRGAFGTNYDIFRNNQNDPFNKYTTLANLGRP